MGRRSTVVTVWRFERATKCAAISSTVVVLISPLLWISSSGGCPFDQRL